MSPNERNAWIRVASILIVFVPYFLHVVGLFQGDAPVARAICVAFVVAAITHTALNMVGETIGALAFGRDQHDERDIAIDAWSLRIAYFALITMLFGALGTFAFIGALSTPSASGRIFLPTFSVTSQYVLFAFVAAEILRHVSRIVCYRRAVT